MHLGVERDRAYSKDNMDIGGQDLLVCYEFQIVILQDPQTF